MAAAAAVSALVAVAPRELVVPVPAQRLDPAPLPQQPELPALAPQVLAAVPVLAHLVVDSALLLDLLSPQSYSAAMARSSP